MNILVTGSSGTIGTRLCEKLLESKHEVTGVDWVENKWNPDVEAHTAHKDLRKPLPRRLHLPHHLPVTSYQLPVTKKLEARSSKLEAPFDALIHLAANARVYELVEDPGRARDNFLTLFHALEFARLSGIQRFLFASSREGYGNIRAEKLTEDMVRVEHCESPYTASKVGGEALVHAYARCYGLETVILRFSNVYGMYDDSVRVVPQFIRQARAGEALQVFGRDKYLDFTYIDDAVNGILNVLDRFEDAKGGTFNIAYGEGHSILDLAKMIIDLLDSPSKIVIGSPRTGEVIRYVADIAKARQTFGYDPKVPFEEGVKKAVEWYARM